MNVFKNIEYHTLIKKKKKTRNIIFPNKKIQNAGTKE